MMEVLEGHRVDRVQETRPAAPAEGYVKEFTRHSNDVLLNLNELRHRNILTDTTLVVGDVHLRAHCAVLVACSGFFYSLYSRRVLLQGRGGSGEQLMTVCLPSALDPSSVSLLLDFMYTSRLPLTPSTVPGVLTVAAYLQMDHVTDTCRDFMQMHCRENMSARHPQLELDSRVSVASVAPNGGDLPNPGPQRLLPTRVPADVGGSLKPGAFPTYQPGSKEMKGEPESPLMGSPTPSPDSPARSSCQPNSPAESNTCSKNLVSDVKASPDPKACNWKKYKYIVLNPLCATTTVKEEEMEEPQSRTSPDRMGSTPKATEEWSGEVPGQIDRQGQASCYEGSGRAPPLGPPPSVDHPTIPPTYKDRSVPPCTIFPNLLPTDPEAAQHAIKRENYYVPYCYSGNIQVTKTVSSGEKPYRCNVCSAQFNRPANLKTHARIHSGEKPYRCDTCGARFVQVAHLRAHVLIHTGEKPYPCHTCGTRFRHLQTLKSHLRIHTGEKPFQCEKCDLHFRHKSQLRLHLRQKHGAVTNTKIRYKVLTEAFQPILQAC
ncbi:B-cell CLL/lymphoma 6 member B protein isoform X2 [Notothenia coriiceps]|uniref:B-cell CLL/lymphoma 6 member B protein isoform X2 n=1 Tax=Notothenia coriiceps TaxID=8208 RepID=A0A6I9MXM0_9TELE|nr:PREDICTED: B-cell CLL/lymphoma 6 member B protein isoform X2 [Notothenia coriiceps]